MVTPAILTIFVFVSCGLVKARPTVDWSEGASLIQQMYAASAGMFNEVSKAVSKEDKDVGQDLEENYKWIETAVLDNLSNMQVDIKADVLTMEQAKSDFDKILLGYLYGYVVDTTELTESLPLPAKEGIRNIITIGIKNIRGLIDRVYDVFAKNRSI